MLTLKYIVLSLSGDKALVSAVSLKLSFALGKTATSFDCREFGQLEQMPRVAYLYRSFHESPSSKGLLQKPL